MRLCRGKGRGLRLIWDMDSGIVRGIGRVRRYCRNALRSIRQGNRGGVNLRSSWRAGGYNDRNGVRGGNLFGRRGDGSLLKGRDCVCRGRRGYRVCRLCLRGAQGLLCAKRGQLSRYGQVRTGIDRLGFCRAGKSGASFRGFPGHAASFAGNLSGGFRLVFRGINKKGAAEDSRRAGLGRGIFRPGAIP